MSKFLKDPQSYINSAEEKFKSNNLEEALKLANMAKTINPKLEGVDNFIAAYQIHVTAASKKKSNGLVDWYDVLGIENFQADTTKMIKKNYNKLALRVHPDKNSSLAAHGAFKLIKDACDILSEPLSRKSFDLRWGPRSFPNFTKETSNDDSKSGNSGSDLSLSSYDCAKPTSNATNFAASDPKSKSKIDEKYHPHQNLTEYSGSNSDLDSDLDLDFGFGAEISRKTTRCNFYCSATYSSGNCIKCILKDRAFLNKYRKWSYSSFMNMFRSVLL